MAQVRFLAELGVTFMAVKSQNKKGRLGEENREYSGQESDEEGSL